MKYQDVVFLDGDRADEYLDVLFNRDSPGSIVYHGPTAESVDATFATMVEAYGDGGAEISDEPSCGSSDRAWEQDGYRISADLSYGHIGLERLVTDDYGTPAWMPPDTMNVADAHNGFTAVTHMRSWRSGFGENTLWRPASVARKGTTGTRIPGTVRHDANWQGNRPVISAEYRLPGYGYRVRVWFTQSGERIA